MYSMAWILIAAGLLLCCCMLCFFVLLNRRRKRRKDQKAEGTFSPLPPRESGPGTSGADADTVAELRGGRPPTLGPISRQQSSGMLGGVRHHLSPSRMIKLASPNSKRAPVKPLQGPVQPVPDVAGISHGAGPSQDWASGRMSTKQVSENMSQRMSQRQPSARDGAMSMPKRPSSRKGDFQTPAIQGSDRQLLVNRL